MKKLLLPVAAAALAAGLCAGPVAHADENSYLTDLANDGFTGQTGVALKMGYAVCTDRQHSVPRDTTVQAIYDAAVIHLC